MNKIEINDLYREADEDLRKAGEELSRPSSDVVSYSACVLARRAIHRFLHCLYLQTAETNSEDPGDLETIEEMLGYCRQSDKRLKELDFDFLHCRGRADLGEEQMFYCNEPVKIGECLSMAEKIKVLVKEEL